MRLSIMCDGCSGDKSAAAETWRSVYLWVDLGDARRRSSLHALLLRVRSRSFQFTQKTDKSQLIFSKMCLNSRIEIFSISRTCYHYCYFRVCLVQIFSRSHSRFGVVAQKRVILDSCSFFSTLGALDVLLTIVANQHEERTLVCLSALSTRLSANALCFYVVPFIRPVRCCYHSIPWTAYSFDKNSSEDEIAKVNIFYDDIAHILHNTKKENLLCFKKLEDS